MIYFMRHKHEQKGVKLLIEDQVAKSENVLVLTRDELGKFVQHEFQSDTK